MIKKYFVVKITGATISSPTYSTSLNGQVYRTEERKIGDKYQVSFATDGYLEDPVPRMTCLGDGYADLTCTTNLGETVTLSGCQTASDPITGKTSVIWCQTKIPPKTDNYPTRSQNEVRVLMSWFLIIFFTIFVFLLLFLIYIYKSKRGIFS